MLDKDIWPKAPKMIYKNILTNCYKFSSSTNAINNNVISSLKEMIKQIIHNNEKEKCLLN